MKLNGYDSEVILLDESLMVKYSMKVTGAELIGPPGTARRAQPETLIPNGHGS